MDPKAFNAIRLVKEMTSGQSYSLAGPIKPKWLTLALPKIGKNRAWIDHVVEGVLCEIINAYRVKDKDPIPFWKGPAYQINRQDLSTQLDCRPRDVSKALVFLEKIGFVTRHQKARFNGGEHAGTVVHVIPDVLAIDRALAAAKKQANSLEGHPGKMSAQGVASAKNGDDPKVSKFDTLPFQSEHSSQSKADSPDAKDGASNHNVHQKARNDTVGRGARQAADAPCPSSSLSGSAPYGGGAAASVNSTSSNKAKATTKSQDGSSSVHHTMDEEEAPVRVNSKAVNRRTKQFLYLWSEAGKRTLHLPHLTVQTGDRKALRRFFSEHRIGPARLVSEAILAWKADADTRRKKYDLAWACRRAKDISTFLRLRSKILSELGGLGYEVNMYRDLRLWFTDSELQQIGINIEPGLDVLDPEECWENRRKAKDYYSVLDLEMPPEVRAASSEPA